MTNKCSGHVACMGEEWNVYRSLMGKPEGKGPLGKPKGKGDNIKIDF